jgi:hypothetical protein
MLTFNVRTGQVIAEERNKLRQTQRKLSLRFLEELKKFAEPLAKPFTVHRLALTVEISQKCLVFGTKPDL